MQVYKAWSVAAQDVAKLCGDVSAPSAAAPVVTPPVTITVRRRAHRRRIAAHARGPTLPVPAVHRAKVLGRPPPRRTLDCPPPTSTNAHLIAADAGDLARWMHAAVTVALARRDLGTEGTATLLAARLDGRLARALERLRNSGHLGDAINQALRETHALARPDCPLERILRSALRRYELRPWLEALARR